MFYDYVKFCTVMHLQGAGSWNDGPYGFLPTQDVL